MYHNPLTHIHQVRIQHKNKGGAGAGHVAFVDAYKALILGLVAYVKQHHATGLAWNAQARHVDCYHIMCHVISSCVSPSTET